MSLSRCYVDSSFRYFVRSLSHSFVGSLVRCCVDFVFPPVCLHCSRLLSPVERHLCTDCWQSIPLLSRRHPLFLDTLGKLTGEGTVSDLVSSFVFEKQGAFQAIAHSLKYDGFATVGVMLGHRLGTTIAECEVKADLLIPVPLHAIKLRERGFNQAERIARGISDVTKIPVEPRALRRTRHTKTQTKLGLDERKKNVTGAFEVGASTEAILRDSRCIIVDDVITTGATIVACAEPLLAAGAASIIAVSAALAQ